MRIAFSVAALSLAAFAVSACSSSEGASDLEEESIDEGALSTAARSLVGQYASDDETYATELDLKTDGTFTGKFNPNAFGVRLMCVRAPCLAHGDGTWNVPSSGRLTLKIKHLTGTTGTRSVTFNQELTRGMIPYLKLDRVRNSLGEQLFRGQSTAGPGCAATLCAPGTRCIERSDGNVACVEIEDDDGPCAGKACGASCRLCNGRPGCVETAVLKFCDSSGQCRSGRAPCE